MAITSTTLAEAMDSQQTTIKLTSGAGFPAVDTAGVRQLMRVDDEVLLVNAVPATNFVHVRTRGDEGSSAVAHAAGAPVLTSTSVTDWAALSVNLSNSLYRAMNCTLTENGAATSYTASFVIPPGSILVDLRVIPRVLWNGTSATLKVGDTADDDGFFVGVNLKATDLLVGEVLSITEESAWGGKNGAYLVAATGQRGPTTSNFGLSYVAGSTIKAIVTPGAADGTAGRTDVLVVYAVPTVVTQVTV
jgi:hypothetical protein